MAILAQILFVLILAVFGYLIYKRIAFIKSNIQLGKDEKIEGDTGQRWRNVFLIAFGQKKMYKRPLPALLHLCVYLGFILINIEVLEIVLDGILGQHRILAPILGGFYPVMISFFEILAVGVILACTIFLIRRNVTKVARFQKAEMKGWPAMDANLILIIEIVLMVAILKMNAADQVLQSRGAEHYPQTGNFLISSMLMGAFDSFGTGFLVVIERTAWWMHIVGIFGFALFVTYSKHLHIFMAFPNTYFAKLTDKGEMANMPEITTEVQMMLGMPVEDSTPPPEGMKFGAKDINHLSWKNLMDAYTCTECGRCTSECPANGTGKQLSPRKIMMDTRDRMEEVGKSVASGGKGLEDGKSLLGDYISHEEINACTSCNACVEACPVMINPLDIIFQLRRYVAMEESGSPASWNAMFQNVETNFAPWKFSPQDRFNWSDELKNEEK